MSARPLTGILLGCAVLLLFWLTLAVIAWLIFA